ncbi:beta-propeller fold lactonase family protein [Microlunatus spumicola]|uniref:beta-propeller fold lactonase family protein n=1 Tax=Microlunatus spumicola TaxID=81499 RepID=UPI00195B946E
MSRPTRTRATPLPGRVVVGGYSLGPDGDGPEAGTGLRVLDLVRGPGTGGTDGPAYVAVGHAALASPTWAVPHPHRPWLVSVGETNPSEVVCTRLEPDGTLTVLGRATTGGNGGCHLALTADGRRAVVAHYGSGTVESFALDDDGRVSGPLDRFTSRAPLGPDPERQDGPHAHQVVLDPGRADELLVCDLGTDRVHRLRLAADGRLSEAAPALVLPPGFGPRHLVVAGDVLVVVGELAAELWVGLRDEDGWRPSQTVPTTRRRATGRDGSTVPAEPSALRLAGDRVVVATRGPDTVGVFALDRGRGTVEPLGEVSCGGRHPRDLVVADGLVWVADQESDEVVVLDLEAAASGREVAPVLRFAAPRPACLVLLADSDGT